VQKVVSLLRTAALQSSDQLLFEPGQVFRPILGEPRPGISFAVDLLTIFPCREDPASWGTGFILVFAIIEGMPGEN
jgi:hypothetical protein